MEVYKKWVRRNKDYVHSLESLANGLTYLLPERFSSTEIGPEAVTAVLGIISAFNEHIIDQGHVSPENSSSFPWSLCISALKDLETLIEVAAEHFYGIDKKWNFIVATEATKVVVRLALFRDSGYKMLLHGGETPNVDRGYERGMGPVKDQRPGHMQPHHARDSRNLEGRALFALNRFGQSAKMVSDPSWLNRLQHRQPSNVEATPQTPVVKKPSISSIWSENGFYGALFLMEEVLHITRPLIYVLLIRKYGVCSWKPWILSLAVDVTGMGILSHIIHVGCRRKVGCLPLSIYENNEVSRRKLLWALYLMRDPFFSNYTRRKLEKTEKLLEPVPIIGFLTAKLIELIIGAQTRYTYMAGS